MTIPTPKEAHLKRLQAQIRKTKAAVRREEHSKALAAHAAAVGCPLSSNDVGYIKNHLPAHITRAIVEVIAQARTRTKRRGTDGDAKARQRAAKRAAGLVQATVWVRPEHIGTVKAMGADAAPVDAGTDDLRLADFFEDLERARQDGAPTAGQSE
jgi:hypothetical protein